MQNFAEALVRDADCYPRSPEAGNKITKARVRDLITAAS
jgi:hypothetical protein